MTPSWSPTEHLPDPVRHAEFYADVPMKRGLAWLVDTVLIAILVALIVPFTAFVALFFLPLLYLAVSFCYRWVALARSSATPGMRLMAIRLRNGQGQPLNGGEAFLHTLGYTVSVAFVIPQIISVALMLLGSRGQGLSDHVLGTVAINRAAQD